ncbi:NAD(P)/FAD-dependent oxidoreductase [Nocardioides aestuarii]|uniref:NAD(P)/FAD-dependent oxidoreductase n=1 Tax=Nocardioides aestuarii TaxID=252231 RepID=A0ABW4TKZ3_9ACTN
MPDLLVVGGGPVGLATALEAARLGLAVEVRERRRGVVDKACGEGLMPGAVQALSRLGVPLEGVPIAGIRYLDGCHEAQADFRTGPGLGVRRTTLHAALRDAARDAGVVLVERPVREVLPTPSGVLVDGDEVGWVVAADGLHSPVRRMLGLDGAPARRRRYGLRTHVRTAPWSRHVEVHWSPRAEAYTTPVAEDLVGVAVLTTARAPLPVLLEDFPGLRGRMAGRETTRVLGAGPLRQRSRARASGRVLLVGDAAGYVDALTGEGLAVGLAQARAAAQAVAAADVPGYEAACRRIGRRHDLLTAGLLAVTGVPVLRQRLVGAASRLPRVFEVAVDQLARPA